jgi:hypothetical protein
VDLVLAGKFFNLQTYGSISSQKTMDFQNYQICESSGFFITSRL